MTDKYEIIVIGYAGYWEHLERTVSSLVRTNTHALNIHVGLNAPSPDMLTMIERYRHRLTSVRISDVNLNKVGLQRALVHRCTATYIVSFDDDSFPIHDGWQSALMARVSTLEAEADADPLGMMGLVFYDTLDAEKRSLLARCPWYDPATKVNHEWWDPDRMIALVWFCAGAFYTFLRDPYVRLNYPGFDYRMRHEDVILSYFYQHHGYRLGDLGNSGDESGLDSKARYAALGTRVIVNDGPRTWDDTTVETLEHSLPVAATITHRPVNEYLMNIIEFLKTLPHVEPDADYLNAADYYPYLNALARDVRATRILEVGVRYGYSAVAFIRGNPVTEYVGLDYDLYDPSSSIKSRTNLDFLTRQQPVDITLFKVDTQALETLDVLGGRRFDFIHIDGDHSYEGALTDLRNFWNALSVGGHMLVDDSIFYGPVREACIEFARQVDEPHYDVKTYRGTWVFLKTRELTFPVRRSSVNEQTAKTSVPDADVHLRFHARHEGWSGPFLLLQDGTFKGGNFRPDGTWELAGATLTLRWHHWPVDLLETRNGGASYQSQGSVFFTLYSEAGVPVDTHLGGNIPGGDPLTFYPELWQSLVERFPVTSVLDVGCGEGHALVEFARLGTQTLGIDGYEPNVFTLRRNGIPHIQHDFTTGPVSLPGTFDLCWCCEFVEHVEERYVDHILSAFTACRIVAMTHAVPQQGGHHHVNCQLDAYWIETLEGAGFEFLESDTSSLRQLYPDTYWGRSGLLFRRLT